MPYPRVRKTLRRQKGGNGGAAAEAQQQAQAAPPPAAAAVAAAAAPGAQPPPEAPVAAPDAAAPPPAAPAAAPPVAAPDAAAPPPQVAAPPPVAAPDAAAPPPQVAAPDAAAPPPPVAAPAAAAPPPQVAAPPPVAAPDAAAPPPQVAAPAAAAPPPQVAAPAAAAPPPQVAAPAAAGAQPPAEAPAAGQQPITGIYIVNAQRQLLIHLRGPRLDHPGTISTPGGGVEQGESHKAAAIRELSEEAQVVPPPEEADLIEFREDGANKFYYWQPRGPLTIGGPMGANVDEVAEFTVTDLSGSKIEGARHFWASLDGLGPWLDAHPAYKNDLFAANLAALLRVLPPAATPVTTQLPKWVPATMFDDEDLELIKAKCGETDFITADCIAKAILKDIRTAEEFVSKYRLKANPDATLLTYQKLAAELATLRSKGENRTQEESNRLAVIEKELSEGYPDHQVLVYNPDEKRVKTLPVPNPYRALAYREEATTSFANPAGAPSQYNVDGVMRAQNVDVLKALAPSEMIADNRMAIALLESFWFCGSNPSISNDPRCFPARILGELREYQQSKRTVRRAATAADRGDVSAALSGNADVKGSAWVDVRQWVQALKQAMAGKEIFPYVPEPPAPPAPAPSVAPAPPAPVPPAPVPPAPPAAPAVPAPAPPAPPPAPPAPAPPVARPPGGAAAAAAGLPPIIAPLGRTGSGILPTPRAQNPPA